MICERFVYTAGFHEIFPSDGFPVISQIGGISGVTVFADDEDVIVGNIIFFGFVIAVIGTIRYCNFELFIGYFEVDVTESGKQSIVGSKYRRSDFRPAVRSGKQFAGTVLFIILVVNFLVFLTFVA